jgi:hypothetical protein
LCGLRAAPGGPGVRSEVRARSCECTEHPHVGLHLSHTEQQFFGSQQEAAVGATVIYAGAKHVKDVPPPSRRKA